MKIVLNILVAAATLFLYPEAEARFSVKKRCDYESGSRIDVRVCALLSGMGEAVPNE